MKKLLFSAALLGVSSYASAALLVSGWSFSGAQASDSIFAGEYSDITADGAASANATIYMNNTHGSSNFNRTMFGGDQAIVDTKSSYNVLMPNAEMTTRLGSPTMTQQPAGALQFNNAQGFGTLYDANGMSFVIEVNALDGMQYEDITLTYAAALQAGLGDIDITWGISYTGFTSFDQLQTDTISTTLSPSGGSEESVSFTGSGSQFWIVGTLGSIDNPIEYGDALVLDNIQILANVSAVPEPSTYAAIAGGLALAIVALRRRLRK